MGVEYYHPNFDGSVDGKKFPLTEEQVKNCSQNGIGVNVWTVNTKEDIRRMKKWGVNAVIGNFPDRGIEVNKE
jgi:glycerophosphoryl diester phosphodiesterase